MSRRPLIGITGFETEYPKAPHAPLYATGQRYVRDIEDAGCLPVILSPGLSNNSLLAVFERLDGLLLSGGGDIDPTIYGEEPHPTVWGLDMNRDRAELALAQWAAETQKPLLCICRGTPVLNVALGGSLLQDIETMQPKALRHMYDQEVTPREEVTHSRAGPLSTPEVIKPEWFFYVRVPLAQAVQRDGRRVEHGLHRLRDVHLAVRGRLAAEAHAVPGGERRVRRGGSARHHRADGLGSDRPALTDRTGDGLRRGMT